MTERQYNCLMFLVIALREISVVDTPLRAREDCVKSLINSQREGCTLSIVLATVHSRTADSCLSLIEVVVFAICLSSNELR